MQKIAALMLAVWAGAATLIAAQPVQPVDVNTLGPQVGQKAVAFQLPDQHGRTRTLTSVAGPKGTMLVFFRSSDW